MPSVTSPAPAGTETPTGQVKKNAGADTIKSNGVESHDGEENESEATFKTDEKPDEGVAGLDSPVEEAEGTAEGEEGAEDASEVVPVGSVNAEGQVVDEAGNVLGKVEGDVPEGSLVDTEGDVLDAEGNVIGKADIEKAAEDAKSGAEGAIGDAKDGAEDAAEGAQKPELAGPFGVQDNGEVTNAAGVPIGKLAEGDPQDLVGRSIKEIDEEGHLKAESGSTIGKVELDPEVLGEEGKLPEGEEAKLPEGEEGKLPEGEEAKLAEDFEGEGTATELGTAVEPPKEELDYKILDGLKVNKLGKVVKEDVRISPSNHFSTFTCLLLPRAILTHVSQGTPVGQLVEGDPKKLAGKKVDAEGNIWNDAGKVIGRAEPLKEVEENVESAPFEDFPEAVVDAKGNIIFEGRIVGKVIEGDPKKLEGKKVRSTST
jgi:hypothetical protein